MKTMIHTTIFLMLSIITAVPLVAQTITNINVAQRTDGSGITDIYFTLAGTAPAYYITVDASFNNGTTYTPVPFSALWGDTGPISAGTGKHITWNGAQSFPNTYSTQAKVKLKVTTTLPAGSPCPGTPTVVYGGQTYNTVQIGTQCWLKENLNIGTIIPGGYNQANNGTIEKYCYNNLESYCNIYGGLYQWAEMVQYLNGATNTSNWNPAPNGNIQGICPGNWHIPTEAEWCILSQYVDPTVNCSTFGWAGTNAGAKLKETGTNHWNNPNTGATNDYGFTALGAGHRDISTSGSFVNLLIWNYSWTASVYGDSHAWQRNLKNDSQLIFRAYNGKGDGGSVRCVRDY